MDSKFRRESDVGRLFTGISREEQLFLNKMHSKIIDKMEQETQEKEKVYEMNKAEIDLSLKIMCL